MPSKVTIIGDKELSRFLTTLEGTQAIKNTIRVVSRKVKNSYVQGLKQNYKTGELQKSVFEKIAPNGKSSDVGSESGIARLIEYGTRPHTIEIKNKKVLSDGVDFFGPKVKHPGYRGNPALTKAYFKNVGSINATRLVKELKTEYAKIK